MGFNKFSKILTEEQQEKLNKLDWYLIASSREVDKILSMFERVKSLGGNYKKVTLKYEKLISFKLKQTQQIIMSIEEDIFNSSFDLYKEHYGVFKNKNTLLEEREIKLSYEFESFLTQLKTILDLFLKYLGEIELNKQLKKIDSFEKITREVENIRFKNRGYNKAKNKLQILIKESLLKEFFKNFDTLYEIKIYRDYVIHHGNIVQNKYISSKERYLEYNYGVPKLTKSKQGYRINNKFTRRLDYFCRLKFLEELHIIGRTLSNVIGPIKIKAIEKEFLDYKPKEVKEVLSLVGRKAIQNDKSIIMENDLKEIIKEKGFDFKNLVEERTNTERVFEGMKSVDGKDMSYALKRTFFKPLGYFHINKMEYIYDRDWNPKNQKFNPCYGIVDFSFELKDLSKKCKRIIDSFIKLGLVIYLKEEDKYTLIDKDLEGFIATLISLNQLKWTCISHTSFTYFRKLNNFEKEVLRDLFGPKFKDHIKDINKKRKEIDKNSDFYKLMKLQLKDSTKKYFHLVKENKEKYAPLIRKYNYLKPALKLINEDIFNKKLFS